MTRPYLEHLHVEDLIGHAGGDPWAVDDGLQAGSPTQINFLAQAFHQAAGSATAAEETFRTAEQHFQQYNRENGEQPINNGAEVQRVKSGLHATKEQLGQVAADLERIAGALAEARATSKENIAALNGNLRGLDALIDYYLQLEYEGYDYAAQITQCRQQAMDDTATALHNVTVIRKNYSKTLEQALTNLRAKNSYQPDDTLRRFDAAEHSARSQNQIDAFRQLFGREPVSATDWATAAALDPHSYDPKSQGQTPQIQVARINPVPGQGVVRTSHWIEQRDVTDLHMPDYPFVRRDFGNDRPADPNFDPGNTKITTYIDYENGVIVMRQNPSVELDPGGGPGQVRVGVPQGTVTQTPDGAVRIKYSGGNPFAPQVTAKTPWPLQHNPWTVNGDLVFTPSDSGIRVDGTRTDYPSMEVYQDSPAGVTRTVIVDPAQSGRSLGPMLNLPGHHNVGADGAAFTPFDTGGWNPRYDVRAPLPQTTFGPVNDPPSVALLRTGGVAS